MSIYLGELAVGIPLFDSESILAQLKERVADYPEALRRGLVHDYLFMAEFTLTAFAPKFAQAPRNFAARVQETLAHVGTSPDKLLAAVAAVAQLFQEARELAGGLYRPPYAVPK